LHNFILNSIKLLVCVIVTVYLAPKVIRKSKPLPAAYDAEVMKQGLKQTAAGRKRLRVVRLTLFAMFLIPPILLCGVVFGLMYWSKPVLRPADISWPELGIPSFLVGINAVLYLMGSGVAIKQHRWKWAVLPIMLMAPILIAPAIPYPASPPGLTPMFESLPPVMLSIGLVWFLSGAATLVLFIWHNPLPGMETQ